MGTEGEVLGKRIVAKILDALALMVFVGGGFVAAIMLGSATEILGMLAFLAVFLVPLYYTYLMEGGYGRTLGKAAMGLVVVKEDGSQCTYGASVIRNLLWIVDGFGIGPFVIALIVFITDRHQRVGDMVASTVVVSEKQ